ncbi:glucan biosynthesis protein [Variovorax ginsengisoli]|uniref:Glucan biosynthesis protein D n=1 Tax=Variovorax ginsengisoli TaxID=363844 RepID=A0ABT8S6V0_9BURK|nr:glucan biosynthesis protein D [Variovorax ginsengisoli]MDN8614522.1 glucan biosynthesis protein D [Variovorax ginsengisoli]MDO1533692.1 glucan biosynthesis protein D [Variovorax ginsengisoli]
MMDRRSLLVAGGASLALASLGLPAGARAAAGLRFSQPSPFSFERLVALSKSLAAKPRVADASLPADVLQRIDYDAQGKIRFDTRNALFRDGPGAFPVTFFHLGRLAPVPVHMYLLEEARGDSFAREILYDAALFTMPADSPARQLPAGAGFAGFRLQESRLGEQAGRPWQDNDWVAFQGASYFRAIGELYQYGLSARGIALDAAVPDRPEEFPDFTRFYFEPPTAGSDAMTVYALLEGPSVTGAYKFLLRRGKGVLMNIECRLFLRRDVERFGLAPLTSMYWYSETVKPAGIDWRPEVHDSDGLAMWNGAGERIWRPLNNPTQTRASTFTDNNPKGFGLLQRDRSFDHYQDGVHYEKRPNLWVEPLGAWGEGEVQLIEIATDDEIHDNVLACWVPKAPASAGSSVTLKYRLHWSAEEPFPSPLARCIATRMGRGGEPGKPRPAGVRKFMVEFIGKPLESLASGVKPELVLTAARGKFSYVFAEAVPNGVAGHWRAQFDFTPEGNEAVDMRLFLKNGEQTLSETWLYQFQPG